METGIARGSVRAFCNATPQTDVKQDLTSISLLHQSRMDKTLVGFARTKWVKKQGILGPFLTSNQGRN